MGKFKNIREFNQIPIVGHYDVIVVGGGVARVGAALAAHRNGCTVLLVEKSIVLGGLATLGFIAYYCPLCDYNGTKVTSGIAEELLRLSIQYGYNTLDPVWKNGKGGKPKIEYTTQFSPPEFIVALDELLEREKVDVLFDTVFSTPVMNKHQCRAVVLENKSGRQAYTAKMFVDASGDADLAFRAGIPCKEEKNYLAYWFYSTSLDLMKKAVASQNILKGIRLDAVGGFRPDGTYTVGKREHKGTCVKDVTRFVMKARRLMKKRILQNCNGKGSILAYPGMAQFRRTRRIVGPYTLQQKDEFRTAADSIGCISHWLKKGTVYEVPYRTLYVQGFPNLLTAGRIISSAGDAWEATRVIQAAVLTGQASGTAAALAIQRKCKVQDVPINHLQKTLARDGVILHYTR